MSGVTDPMTLLDVLSLQSCIDVFHVESMRFEAIFEPVIGLHKCQVTNHSIVDKCLFPLHLRLHF